MSRKNKIIIALVVLVPVAIFIVISLLNSSGDVSVGQILTEYGFTELKPPSTLIKPGTWIEVLNTEPLHVSIICTPENALGLEGNEELRDSPSIDAQMVSKLSKSFELGASALEKVKGAVEFSEIKKISFQLKSIKLLELPDDAVMRALPDRKQHCLEAIRFRVEGEQLVSMIKSVLIADMYYRVEFDKKLSSDVEAKLKEELALELDLRLQTAEDGSQEIVGRNLVWGIREDARLATVGLTLPPTGGPGEDLKVIPAAKGIVKISKPENRFNKFYLNKPLNLLDPEQLTQLSRNKKIIAYNVKPLKQSSNMSCWATVYAMMKSWKENKDYEVNKVVAKLGNPWNRYYLSDNGLPAGKEKSFVRFVGMNTEPPANYTIEAYITMLRDHGPLWIITGDGLSSHARLLIGIYGQRDREGELSYEETLFEFIDPLWGTYKYETALDFAHKFEQEARWLVDGKFDDIELRDQILHWP